MTAEKMFLKVSEKKTIGKLGKDGRPGGARTHDQRIMSPLL